MTEDDECKCIDYDALLISRCFQNLTSQLINTFRWSRSSEAAVYSTTTRTSVIQSTPELCVCVFDKLVFTRRQEATQGIRLQNLETEISNCVCFLKEVKGTFPKSWSMKLFYELPRDSLVKFQMESQKMDLCSCEWKCFVGNGVLSHFISATFLPNTHPGSPQPAQIRCSCVAT